MEKITKDEFKIVSKHLTNLIDWEEVYNSSNPTSKKMFTKEDIIGTVKKLVTEYPLSFDTSSEGRIECNTSVLRVRFGMFNNYIYLLTNAFNYTTNGWFMTEYELMKAVKYHTSHNDHIVIFDYKHYLRLHKLKKLQQKINI